VNTATPAKKQPAAAEEVRHAPAQQQEAAEGQRVSVDHPLQVRRAERRPCWIEGSATFTTVRVEDDHQLGDADDRDAQPGIVNAGESFTSPLRVRKVTKMDRLVTLG